MESTSLIASGGMMMLYGACAFLGVLLIGIFIIKWNGRKKK